LRQQCYAAVASRSRSGRWGSSLYCIHGANEASTISHNVSSGCVRMMNEDLIDLYNRVLVAARVIVL
jgi:lipoprotein-anchoring transpeptidase ErfK/SrfK